MSPFSPLKILGALSLAFCSFIMIRNYGHKIQLDFDLYSINFSEASIELSKMDNQTKEKGFETASRNLTIGESPFEIKKYGDNWIVPRKKWTLRIVDACK